MATPSKQSCRNAFIPQDIITDNILPRLPPKSLVCFQCVSKLWTSIIFYRNFKLSPEQRNRALALSHKTVLYRTTSTYKLLNNNLCNPLRIQDSVEEPAAPEQQIDHIFGSCNGLFLYSKGINLFFWNPCTSFCQKVLELDTLSNCVHRLITALCYDPCSEDYIVLACFRELWSGEAPSLIYTTFKTKKWTNLVFPYYMETLNTTPVCVVNNLIHLLVASRDVRLHGNCNTVVYFDIRSNGFKRLPLPTNENVSELVGLGVLDNLLCLMRVNIRDVEFLVLKEYGVQESWTPIFSIQDVIIPWAYRGLRVKLLLSNRNTDVLLLQMDSSFYAYYPNCGILEEITVPVQDAYEDIMLVPYTCSLFSPTGFNWNE